VEATVTSPPLLDVRAVRVAYPGSATPVLRDVSLQFAHGDYVAILGPNGAGKSTLLRLLAGTLLPSRGEVLLEGVPLRRRSRREVARRIAVLPQRLHLPFDAGVEDLVGLGRTPHLTLPSGLWGPTARDRAAIEGALQATGTAGFRAGCRPRQRVQ
jgi:iron complex transport system ATP-binding protein